MPDPREQLRQRFANNRYQNFGNVITKMAIRGIRCHGHTVIDIACPITAFSGLNGTGKSTLMQLAASSYKHDDGHFSISDFIIRGALDPRPFADDASLQTTFETQQVDGGKGLVSPGTVKLAYSAGDKRWDGYDRRPTRRVFYGGIGVFLPRSERKDYFFKNADRLKVDSTNPVCAAVSTWAPRILKCGYETIIANELRFRTVKERVLSTTATGNSYSESHMGCGEGRVLCLLATLEALPDKSLILLEEPETSLHPDAEYELGKYLMDLCLRRGHQIMMTTHSEMLLRSLPQAALVHLVRREGIVHCLTGLISAQASSLMAEGHVKALTILVEDVAAKLMLTELLRHRDDAFLRTVHIAIAGSKDREGRPRGSGKDAIGSAMISLANAGIKIAAVLDGGETADTTHFVFKLPGTLVPEEALIQCDAVKEHLCEAYPILDIAAIERELAGMDCHDYFKHIGRKIDCDEEFLLREFSRAYAPHAAQNEVTVLIEQLREAAAR